MHTGQDWSKTRLLLPCRINLIIELLKVLCKKWWALLTSRLNFSRSSLSSINKGCCLCSFFHSHHCSYIKLCGHSAWRHLRDLQCPSITTRLCHCQRFCTEHCSACQLTCSSKILFVQSHICTLKIETDSKNIKQYIRVVIVVEVSIVPFY